MAACNTLNYRPVITRLCAVKTPSLEPAVCHAAVTGKQEDTPDVHLAVQNSPSD